MLYRMFYTSEFAPGFEDHDLQQVVEVSRSNNAHIDVTGILITHQGKFFQCLEGPKMEVERLFGRIGRDPRHTNLAIVGKGPIRTRAFARWRMACKCPTDFSDATRDAVFSIYSLAQPHSVDMSDDPQMQAQINSFLAEFEALVPPAAEAPFDEMRRAG